MFRKYRVIAIAVIASIVVVVGVLLLTRSLTTNTPEQSSKTAISPSLATPNVPTDSTVVSKNPGSDRQPGVASENSYGHFAYPEADRNRLMLVASYAKGEDQRFESMDIEAGKALMKLIYAARDDRVWIIPVSGFRTVEQQRKLFSAQIQRRGSEKEAAKLSAPPGYSEHATGYAVDLTDGRFVKQDVKFEFETTEAFSWLTQHAKEYGFEMSFPKDNPQGVSYEPWHWRFSGSPSAAQTFATARKPS